MGYREDVDKGVDKFLDAIVSVQCAVRDAGGSIDVWKMKDTSLYDFLRMCANNNIRFVYEKPKGE